MRLVAALRMGYNNWRIWGNSALARNGRLRMIIAASQTRAVTLARLLRGAALAWTAPQQPSRRPRRRRHRRRRPAPTAGTRREKTGALRVPRQALERSARMAQRPDRPARHHQSSSRPGTLHLHRPEGQRRAARVHRSPRSSTSSTRCCSQQKFLLIRREASFTIVPADEKIDRAILPRVRVEDLT